jgi:flagellar biosynthesis regulator FlaF
MASTDIDFDLPGAEAEFPTHMDLNGIGLDHYLINTNRELECFARTLERGDALGTGARVWILDQVDFIVETIGDESQDLSDELRSSLLQLLLAIANLNEQARRQTPAGS